MQEYEVRRTGPKENPFQVFVKSNDGGWPLSEHPSVSDAQRAMQRYRAADKRRAKPIEEIFDNDKIAENLIKQGRGGY